MVDRGGFSPAHLFSSGRSNIMVNDDLSSESRMTGSCRGLHQ